MSAYDPKEMCGADFERSLVDSARADPVPENVQIAWANFAGAMRSAVSHVEPGSGLHAIRHSGENTGLSQGVRVGFGRGAAWLVVGAIGGSALTAALLLARPEGVAGRHAVAHREPPIAAAIPSAGNVAPKPVSTLPTPVVVASGLGQAPSPAHLGRQTTKPAPAGGMEQSPPVSSSDAPTSALAAEVRRLDAARSACRNGAYNEAIGLVQDYHREFPQGVLAPDADVVAIEAFLGKKDHAAVVQHATAFLAKYPDDPHSDMVQRWATP